MKRLAIVLLFVWMVGVPATSLAESSVSIDRVTYRGWVDSYRLSAGPYSLVVVPEIGGRIMEYSLDGENVIWENREEYGRTYPMAKTWHNYGGYKTWVAPQALWDAVPEPELDYGKANVEVIENSEGHPTLKITGAPGLRTGVVLTKEISLDESGELLIKERMHNISGKPVEYSIWVVTQVKTPCFVAFPLNPDSMFPDGVSYLIAESKDSDQFRIRDGLSITEYMGELGKIGADTDGPWMAWFKDDLAYVKLFEPLQEGKVYPDGGCSAEVFTSDAEYGYLEMETLGPMLEIEPGEYIEYTHRWRIFRLTQKVTDEDRVMKAVEGMKGKGWIP